jgi:hypothetical protein
MPGLACAKPARKHSNFICNSDTGEISHLGSLLTLCADPLAVRCLQLVQLSIEGNDDAWTGMCEASEKAQGNPA